MERKDGRSIRIELIDLDAGAEAPKMAAYAVERSGKILRKLGPVVEGKFVLDPGLEKEKALRIGFGPDEEKLEDVRRESLVLFRVADALKLWEKNPVVSIPPDIYRDWLRFRVCVSGNIKRCFPYFFRLPWPLGDFPRLPSPFSPPRLRCVPICDGVVEVYQRTCCCTRIRLIDLGDLIDRLRDILLIPIPIPDPDPGPLVPPGPRPGPDPSPIAGLDEIGGIRSLNPQPLPPRSLQFMSLNRSEEVGFNPQPDPPLVRTADSALQKQALAQGMTLPSGEMRAKMIADIAELESLRGRPVEELQQFVELRPYLWHWICRCTSHKLGETTLRPDGGFTFCWRNLILWRYRKCHTTYFYKVKQRINGVWVYIYDGGARHEYFERSEFARLETMFGRACNTPDDEYDHNRPFVLLEGIGGTPSSQLVSHWSGMNAARMDLTQISNDAVSVPPLNGGLAFPPAPLSSDENVLKNCPWGGDLHLRLHFSPDMESAPVNAEYYRVTFKEADDNGQPLSGAPLLEFSEQLSWNYYANVGGHTEIQSELLGPFPTNIGEAEPAYLYKIPFANDHDWTTDVIHHAVFRTGTRSGKYLIYVEVFDAAGNRLKPTVNHFDFLRRMTETGPNSLATVHFDKIAHYFWIDNKKCVGDIVDIRKDGVESTDVCQFRTGLAKSKVSIGYRAYHDTRNSDTSNPHTFMWTHGLSWTRGLGGGSGSFDADNRPPSPPVIPRPGLNQPHTLAAAVAESGSHTFAEMLGTNTVGAKCTFSVYLRSYAKHTNGSYRLDGYDADETASFALEITA